MNNMEEYKRLLLRLKKAEEFFCDQSVPDTKKLKYIDEFNAIQKRIAEIERDK